MNRVLRWAVTAICLCATAPFARGAREEGIDVSEWQFDVDWPAVRGAGKTFAFIRATRGGTTGTINSGNGRYDDPRFIENITESKVAGVLAGPYHFARPDIATSNPEDEAQHFLEIAGAYMTEGYLRPVLDLEAGEVETTTPQLTDWTLRFCNAIAAAKGEAARPIIYTNRHYANTQLTDTMTVGGKKLSDHPLWLANYDGFNYATNAPTDPQTDPTPPPYYLGADNPRYPNPLGLWGPDSGAMPKSWAFWQYTSLGAVPGVDPTLNTVDLNVFHSELGSIQMFVIPEPGTLSLLGIAALGAMRRRRWRRRRVRFQSNR